MRAASAAALALVAVLAAGDLVAQSAEDLAARCTAAGGDAATCTRGAGAGRDIAGYVGVLTGPGSAVPGQASTLGMRIGGAPRFAVSVRAAGVSVVMPDGPTESSSFTPALDATLALGVFEGLSVLPTVGGVFSLDVFGTGTFALLSADQGFDGRLSVFSAGARVGVLRESFTLPAVTLSVARRFSGEVVLGDGAFGGLGQVGVDPGITSLRATVGKDVFAFGVLVGVGWDDFSSATTLRVSTGPGASTTQTGDVATSRRSYFFGLSKQLGVLSWISGEVGWAKAFEPVQGGASASPDPGRQVYAGMALVLKL
jgi:hypothetical protein